MDRYLGSLNEAAVNEYCALAESSAEGKQKMTPSQLALSWCHHNPNVASCIVGATTLAQLEENLKAYDLKLDDDVMKRIDDTYKKYTDPTKARNDS